jgi:hypothetical protein
MLYTHLIQKKSFSCIANIDSLTKKIISQICIVENYFVNLDEKKYEKMRIQKCKKTNKCILNYAIRCINDRV